MDLLVDLLLSLKSFNKISLQSSVSKMKFRVDPNVYLMTIQLLARSNRYAELGMFVINKVVFHFKFHFDQRVVAFMQVIVADCC